jgi:hypothetical protein
MFNPLVLGLGVFAANEHTSAQRSAGPPVAGRKANGGLHDKGDKQVF